MAKRLVAFAAAVEVTTGLGLIFVPALVARLLLGGDLAGVGLAVGRIAGLGLLSLGVACWPRADGSRPRYGALLIYNLLISAYLAYLGLDAERAGPLLLPAIGLHALLTVLLFRQKRGPAHSSV